MRQKLVPQETPWKGRMLDTHTTLLFFFPGKKPQLGAYSWLQQAVLISISDITSSLALPQATDSLLLSVAPRHPMYVSSHESSESGETETSSLGSPPKSWNFEHTFHSFLYLSQEQLYVGFFLPEMSWLGGGANIVEMKWISYLFQCSCSWLWDCLGVLWLPNWFLGSHKYFLSVYCCLVNVSVGEWGLGFPIPLSWWCHSSISLK